MENPLYDHELDAVATMAGGVAAHPGRPAGDREAKSRPDWLVTRWWASIRLSLKGSLWPLFVLRAWIKGSRLGFAWWVGTALFVICSWSLLMDPLVAAAFGARILAPPFLGAIWLLGALGLAAFYGMGVRGRLDRFRSDPRGKGATVPELVLAGCGFLGGTIPGSLRVLATIGLLGGLVATLALAMSLSERIETSPTSRDDWTMILGDGVVSGAFERIEASGRFSHGRLGRDGSGSGTGGTISWSSPEPSWIHFESGGTAVGPNLRVEPGDRGTSLEGRVGFRAWTFAEAAALFAMTILIAGCVAAALGRPIGSTLLATWAIADIGWSLLLEAWAPNPAEHALFSAFAAAILVVLCLPGVRLYLGRVGSERTSAGRRERASRGRGRVGLVVGEDEGGAS